MNFKDKKALKKAGFDKNKDVYPPRGSSINIPNEVLSNSNEEALNKIIENKSKTIGSDLYKQK
ncbi:MAG: hypothetical protein GX021_03355 [Tissierellia bacterium]|nr:hypothetical protein [Tissierellia bacterium]